MINKYIKYTLSFLSILLLFSGKQSTHARSVSHHGLVAKIFFAPYGVGNINAPYFAESIGTYASKTNDNKPLQSFSGKKFTLGYFYDRCQSEFSYFKTLIKNQEIEETQQNQIIPVSGNSTFFEMKIGKRFNTPGDTSYSWLYIGGKWMKLKLNLSDTSATGIGYFIGYYAFHSTGMQSDFEFIFDYDFYLGMYKKSSISSDIKIEQKKDNSISTGISLGVGMQYEPYNLSCLLKCTAELNQISKKGTYAGGSVNLGASTSVTYIGVELIYILPNYKFNLRDK